MLILGNITRERGGDLMRFYTQQHPFYCGIDLHARSMDVCILNQESEIMLHRNMPAGPEPFLKAVAPYRSNLVVCVECIFTWYWLADLCAREGIPFVLGHALYMKAIHGGKAKNDKIDAQKIAILLRGGMLPQAYVYPAEMRATRDLLRRRMHLMRKRAELLTHVQQTNSQYNLPEIGKKIAYKTNRTGVAERFADPAVQKSIEVDLALIDYYDELLRDLELASVTTAKQHDANTLYLLQTVPGIGKILSLVLLYAMHDIARFPVWKTTTPQAQPGPCGPSRWPVPALPGANARGLSRGSTAANAQGGERRSLVPHGLPRGRTAQRRPPRLAPRRRCTPRRRSVTSPCARPPGWDLRARSGGIRCSSPTACGGGPAPEPGAHGTTPTP
jgi:transposase